MKPNENQESDAGVTSAWLGSVFVISWDRDPQPWEDWSFPFRVIVGTEEQAKAHARKLQEDRGGLFSVQEVKGEGSPIVCMPNAQFSEPTKTATPTSDPAKNCDA
jgi:hypothetical protein